jgi:hypothetical protein
MDPFGPPDLGLGPAPEAPQMPTPTSTDPSKSAKLIQLALMGLAGGLGPGAGTGILRGLHTGVQQRQQQAREQDRYNQQQYQAQRQDYELQARQYAAEQQRREQILQQNLTNLRTIAPKLQDKAEYDRYIEAYTSGLQGLGFRMNPNFLRSAVPYVAPTAKDTAAKALEAFWKNPQNETLKKNPEQLANTYIQFDRDGDGTPEMVPFAEVSTIAQMPVGMDDKGNPIKLPKGTTEPQKANADTLYNESLQLARAEGKDVDSNNPSAIRLRRKLLNDAIREAKVAADLPNAPKEPSMMQVTEIDQETGEIVTSLVPKVPGEVSRKPPKEPTQGQFTAGGYASRIEQAEAVLSDVEQKIAGMGELSFRAQRAAPSAALQSADFQSYDQASRNFINAVLRRESGAAIAPSEFENARRQYLPVPGDTKETLAQKKANRDLVFANLKQEAGRAYRPPPTLKVPGATGGDGWVDVGNGVRIRKK